MWHASKSPCHVQLCLATYVTFGWLSRADSRFAPSQWETALHCNDISNWLGANLESTLLSTRLPFLQYIRIIAILQFCAKPLILCDRTHQNQCGCRVLVKPVVCRVHNILSILHFELWFIEAYSSNDVSYRVSPDILKITTLGWAGIRKNPCPHKQYSLSIFTQFMLHAQGWR